MNGTKFILTFEGNAAEKHELDFYDVAQAMVGFQRSLAITTHLLINHKIIVQAPSLKGAEIITIPPERGSWRVVATIVVGAVLSPVLGHLSFSLYDYVISETMGFHVEYDKGLASTLNNQQKDIFTEGKLDSLIEKCESAILLMHRPVVMSQTASHARILGIYPDGEKQISKNLTENTYDYIRKTTKTENIEAIEGTVSSYNLNTHKGRIFAPIEARPVAFELSPEMKNNQKIKSKIVDSLSASVKSSSYNTEATIRLLVYKNESSTGRLKGYLVVGIVE